MWIVALALAACGPGELDEARYADCVRTGEEGWYVPTVEVTTYDASGFMVTQTEDWDQEGALEVSTAWTRDAQGRAVEILHERAYPNTYNPSYTRWQTWGDDDSPQPTVVETDRYNNGSLDTREEIELVEVAYYEGGEQPERLVFDHLSHELYQDEIMDTSYDRETRYLDEEGHVVREEWDGGPEVIGEIELLTTCGWADGLLRHCYTLLGTRVLDEPEEAEIYVAVEGYWTWDEDGFEQSFERRDSRWSPGETSYTTYTWDCPGGGQ